MRFIDEAKIRVTGGSGGDGCMSFLREKFRPNGGPDGGDGGKGGTVYIEASEDLSTLQDVKLKREFAATRGVHGLSKNQHGRSGEDIVIRVPVGTVIHDAESGELLADLTEKHAKCAVAEGGRGGKGNARFSTRTNKAPIEHEEGFPGESRMLTLELKLLADVGLIGLPNAGKSTLLSSISSAKPKIADYPFTTLNPILGIASPGLYRSFTVADIPGLIEGAHEGHGLGIQFLRHIERTKVLVHLLSLIDEGGAPYPIKVLKAHYSGIRGELTAFGNGLDQKPEIIVFTKCDSCRDLGHLKKIKTSFKANPTLFFISAPLHEGLEELVRHLGNLLDPR